MEEANADEAEEKVEVVEAVWNLPEGDRDRSTGPLDLVLEEDVVTISEVFVNGKKTKKEKKEREKTFFFRARRLVDSANLASLKGRIYRIEKDGADGN